jgi:hypothetical protein
LCAGDTLAQPVGSKLAASIRQSAKAEDFVFIFFDVGFDAEVEVVGRAHLPELEEPGERGEQGGDRGEHGWESSEDLKA